jgi:TPP-dependent pyruvate/acetoin dehydrogenase alpha subunit
MAVPCESCFAVAGWVPDRESGSWGCGDPAAPCALAADSLLLSDKQSLPHCTFVTLEGRDAIGMKLQDVASQVAPARPLAREEIFELGRDRLRETLALMWRVRFFEEEAEELYNVGKVHGTFHLSIGQEAVPAGWSLALEPDDYLLSHHRGHGHCMAKGAEVGPMIAELLGKETGYCRGRGGSMHIADVSRRNLGANGIVGGGIPIAVGLGLSIQMKKASDLVLCIFGDGAANQGSFHEALNLAAFWNVPVIFLCENNQYAMSMAQSRAMRVTVAERAKAYGIPGVRIDGNDISVVYGTVAQVATAVRAGEGPQLVEAVTYRHRGHSRSDRNLYRTKAEIEQWRQHDPIGRLERALIMRDLAREEEIVGVREAAHEQILDAVRQGEGDPEPRCDDLLEGIYAP